MENLTFTGVVQEITQARSFTDKNGTMHSERTLVVQSDERYPQKAAIRLIDWPTTDLPEVGANVQCLLDINARFTMKEINGETEKLWFNDVKAWRVKSFS